MAATKDVGAVGAVEGGGGSSSSSSPSSTPAAAPAPALSSRKTATSALTKAVGSTLGVKAKELGQFSFPSAVDGGQSGALGAGAGSAEVAAQDAGAALRIDSSTVLVALLSPKAYSVAVAACASSRVVRLPTEASLRCVGVLPAGEGPEPVPSPPAAPAPRAPAAAAGPLRHGLTAREHELVLEALAERRALAETDAGAAQLNTTVGRGPVCVLVCFPVGEAADGTHLRMVFRKDGEDKGEEKGKSKGKGRSTGKAQRLTRIIAEALGLTVAPLLRERIMAAAAASGGATPNASEAAAAETVLTMPGDVGFLTVWSTRITLELMSPEAVEAARRAIETGLRIRLLDSLEVCCGGMLG